DAHLASHWFVWRDDLDHGRMGGAVPRSLRLQRGTVRNPAGHVGASARRRRCRDLAFGDPPGSGPSRRAAAAEPRRGTSDLRTNTNHAWAKLPLAVRGGVGVPVRLHGARRRTADRDRRRGTDVAVVTPALPNGPPAANGLPPVTNEKQPTWTSSRK